MEREFSVTVPYRESELIPKEDGKVYVGKRIDIFGGGFYLGDREPVGGNYSASENKTSVSVFGASLPVTVCETVWCELTEREIIRTPEEAEALARERANETLSRELGEDTATFTEYTVYADEENGTVTVNVRYRCITEIAVSAEIGRSE